MNTRFTARPYCLPSLFESSTVAIPHLPHVVDVKSFYSTFMSMVTYSVPRSPSFLTQLTSRSSNFHEVADFSANKDFMSSADSLHLSMQSVLKFCQAMSTSSEVPFGVAKVPCSVAKVVGAAMFTSL